MPAQRPGRRQPAGRRRLGSSCSRRSPRWAAPCAATARCTPTSCTTRSARSTPSPRRRPRSPLAPGGARPHVAARAGRARPPLGDGEWALLHRDREVTAVGLDAPPRRRRGLARPVRDLGPLGRLVDALTSPFPPGRAGGGAGLPAAGGLDTVRKLTPVARWVASLRRPRRPAPARRQRRARRLPAGVPRLRPLRGAADDARSDGRLPGPRGWRAGPDRRARRAVRRRWAPHRDGHARRGLRRARRREDRGRRPLRRPAVIADVAAAHLFGGLVPADDLPARVVTGCAASGSTRARSRSTGRWTVRSRGRRPGDAPGTVHVADSVDQMTETLGQVDARAVPDDPSCSPGR